MDKNSLVDIGEEIKNEEIAEDLKTRNGCWNCVNGGYLKILHGLVKNLQYEYNINIDSKSKKEILSKLEDRIKPGCSLSPKLTPECGLICKNWKWDNYNCLEVTH